MISPFNQDASAFRSVSPFYASDESRGLDVKLTVGSGDIRDDRGVRFNRRLEFRFQGDRIWIPCFVYIEEYRLIFNGSERSAEYISSYAFPKDISELAFIDQFRITFNRAPSRREIERFWADVVAVVELFLKQDRSFYVESVDNPAPPRFVVFESGQNVQKFDWTKTNWSEVASRALAAMRAAREA